MCSCAPAIKDKNPPDNSIRIARGLRGSCRVHKPGVPRRPASQQRLSPSRQRVTHGPAQVSEQQVRRAMQSPTERSGRGGATPVFQLQPTSPTRGLTPVSSPPPDGLFDRRAWPNTASDSDPHLRPGILQTPAHCSSLTGTIRTAWNHPTGDARSVRTRERTGKARQGAQVKPQNQGPYSDHLRK